MCGFTAEGFPRVKPWEKLHHIWVAKDLLCFHLFCMAFEEDGQKPIGNA
jgi:hypothetical protein